MNTVFENLYDIVEKRLLEEGKNMPCSKQAFLYASEVAPGVCDGKKMAEMDNAVFMESVYAGVLCRFPDESAKQAWKMETEKPPAEFRQALLDAVLRSGESLVKGGQLKNNIITDTKMRPLVVLDQIISGDIESATIVSEKMGLKDYLYKGYLKLPRSWRSIVHKVLRRG